MHYTFSELIWLVLIYSFLGWFIETIVGTIRKKKFVNRGFSSGPFCFIYGNSSIDHDHFSGRSGKSAVFPVSRMHDNCYDDRMGLPVKFWNG